LGKKRILTLGAFKLSCTSKLNRPWRTQETKHGTELSAAHHRRTACLVLGITPGYRLTAKSDSSALCLLACATQAARDFSNTIISSDWVLDWETLCFSNAFANAWEQ
jgi:hypothetical protein